MKCNDNMCNSISYARLYMMLVFLGAKLSFLDSLSFRVRQFWQLDLYWQFVLYINIIVHHR